jgi:hypothetical protein
MYILKRKTDKSCVFVITVDVMHMIELGLAKCKV